MFGQEPVAAVAAIDRHPETGVDWLTSGMLRFDGGQVTFSSAGQLAPHQRVQLFGEHGWIDVETPFTASPVTPGRIVVHDAGRPDAEPAAGIDVEPVDQYTLQGDRFSAAIRGVGEVPCSIDDGIANMAVIDALFRSAETGRWEKPA
jgi:predicted dehydrogenase